MRFGFHKTALLIGAAALLTPVVASAQVNLDQAQSDVRVFQGSVSGEPATFEVNVPAGSVMQIDVISTSDLDPIVTVTDAVSGDVIAEDDDGGDDLNSRVRIRGEDAGRRIVISVNSFDATWMEDGEEYGGSFDLRLATSTYTAPATRTVTFGARETGSVQGEPHLFTFQAQAGDTIEVAMLSEGELDPYLELRDASGEAINYDDDGGDGLNSLLRHTFDEAGTYTIAAMGYGESTGDFTLRVRERREIAAQLPLQMIGLDDTATGELGSQWEDSSDLPSTIMYQLNPAAIAAIRNGDGQVTIRMDASDEGDPDFGGSIDPFVELGFDTPLGFAVATSDDDGSGSLNALLPVDLGLLADHPGLLDMMRIRVQAYGGSRGAYTLTITEGMESRVEGYDDIGMVPPPVQITPVE
ncbi:pre-peptidase C-terminal domain-containing protein [Erythrobacter alti]|uniref:pre-peptidase C-terminal domain-containing protein n=1 Tax=Erythrobacter alti TaxID=1896145 RepID=UPI0030F42B00